MQRGEVWWARLAFPAGPRPVLILTRNQVVNSIAGIVVAPITTRRRNLDSELALGGREGLPRPSVANMDNILTISREHLVQRLGALAAGRIADLDRALKFALDIR